MTTLKTLISAVLLIGCGGSSKPATAPAPDPAPVAAPEPAPAPDPVPEAKPEPAPALAMGAAKFTLEIGPDAKADVVINADGTFTGTATSMPKTTGKAKAKAKAKPEVKKKTGKLSERAAWFDGKESARLGEDGSINVLQGMKEIREGKVVKDESSWKPVGVLDAAGVFTMAKDNTKVSFGDDGKLTGIPDLKVTFEGPPEMRRTALFMVVAMMAGGTATVESSTQTSPNNVTAPAPTK